MPQKDHECKDNEYEQGNIEDVRLIPESPVLSAFSVSSKYRFIPRPRETRVVTAIDNSSNVPVDASPKACN